MWLFRTMHEPPNLCKEEREGRRIPTVMLADGSPDGLVRDFCFYSQCLSSRPGKAEGLPIRNVVLARQ